MGRHTAIPTLTILLSIAVTLPGLAGESRRLREPETIDGVPCRTKAWFHDSGRLASCTLDAEATLEGRTLPAGTRVGLDERGRPGCVFLPGPTEIDGHVCRGKGHGFQTCFHPNGALRFCNLEQPEWIQGVPCQRSTFFIEIFVGRAGVTFHEDGRLRGCLLAGPFERDGRRLERGTRVEFDAEGALQEPSPGGGS